MKFERVHLQDVTGLVRHLKKYGFGNHLFLKNDADNSIHRKSEDETKIELYTALAA